MNAEYNGQRVLTGGSIMIKYFLGANTHSGFYSLFDGLYSPTDGWRLFIIKGGPGTGKSSVMKKIAEEAENRGYSVERIYCSSDPSSLDGVIIPEIRTSVADGTAPHVLEPKYPGAVETTVNLSDCWNASLLRENAENIIEKSFECKSYHERCVRFLKAYASFKKDNERLIMPSVDTEKAVTFAKRTALREFGSEAKEQGALSRRFLSAVTPEGITCFEETVCGLCERVVVIKDEDGAVSNLILHGLAESAVKSGLDVTVCPCVTDPARKIDHLIIREKSLAFFTENDAHLYSSKPYKTVSAGRFIDSESIKRHRSRLSFNRRAAAELLDEAVYSLASAKEVHDELEQYYISAMDFELVTEKAEKLLSDIFDG
jgi:hypothetical protein